MKSKLQELKEEMGVMTFKMKDIIDELVNEVNLEDEDMDDALNYAAGAVWFLNSVIKNYVTKGQIIADYDAGNLTPEELDTKIAKLNAGLIKPF